MGQRGIQFPTRSHTLYIGLCSRLGIHHRDLYRLWYDQSCSVPSCLKKARCIDIVVRDTTVNLFFYKALRSMSLAMRSISFRYLLAYRPVTIGFPNNHIPVTPFTTLPYCCARLISYSYRYLDWSVLFQFFLCCTNF